MGNKNVIGNEKIIDVFVDVFVLVLLTIVSFCVGWSVNEEFSVGDEDLVSVGTCASMVVNVSGECGLQLNQAFMQGQEDTLQKVFSQLDETGEVIISVGEGQMLVLVPKKR